MLATLVLVERLNASTPEKTRKKIASAVKLFSEWHQFRLETTLTTEGEINVLKDIAELVPADLDFCLHFCLKFVTMVQKYL